VNLVKKDHVDQFIHQLSELYKAKTGLTAAIFATTPSQGAHLS
jgi:galactokinase